AVLRVHFRAQWKEFPLPKISMTLPLVDELPVLKASIQISVANDSPFHFVFENISAPDPEIKRTTYSTSYGWVLENIPAHRNEVLSAPGQNPRLLISTFTDWKAFAEWYGRISRLTDEVTPELAAKAKELTTGATTDRDKVSALYNFVTTLRYVAVPLGVNSVRPHSAANVLQNQFGDCKDKANLLNALLHALDIDAHLVLVPRFSQAHEAVPGLAFNHAISRVTLGGETLWLDTTDDVCRFGMLPPGDPGRKVLPIDGQMTTLVQMPLPSPDDHRLTISGRIGWPEKQEGFPAELTVTAKGYPDYELRTIVRQAKDRHASAPLLAARYRPVAGSFALKTQTATAASALGDDYVWQAQGACIGLAAGPANTTRLRSPFWVPREWDLALHQRQSALFLNQGYPLTLEEEFDFKLPPGAKPGVLPPPIGNDRPPLRWRVEWASLGHEKISARFSAQMPSGELTEAATVLAQEQLRTLLMALASEAGVTLSE
ncbi:MAG TPA: transglutaminase domain-containing protein, partial [Verrucomicrobiae bacterium]